MSTDLPAWWFPAPVRRSRFLASSAAWRPYNIEAAPDRVQPFEFGRRAIRDVLHFDYQTQLDGNRRGRHGSGRGGVYRGYYVKGVGRTPAAANWNSVEDRYHGSGCQTPASALRELLITRALARAGCAEHIVGCRTLLAQHRDERLITLSLKPADFARMSNIAWSLNHFSVNTPELAGAILDFERYLRPPADREAVEGDPEGIASAMEEAFERGLAMFRTFARVGLFWIYLQNNFTLDGRFVDLETPLYLGRPFLGLFEQDIEGTPPRRVLGFEEFGFVWNWRLFVSWLKAKLGWLGAGDLLEPPARAFVRQVRRAIAVRFAKGSLLYDDARLRADAVRNLTGAMDVGPTARKRIAEIAAFLFRSSMLGREGAIPDLGWMPMEDQPAGPTEQPCRIVRAGFLPDGLGETAAEFRGELRRLSAITRAKALVEDPAIRGDDGNIS